MTNRQYSRCRVTAQSTWKKSVASIVDAWVRRNFRHVMSERRSGAGGVFSALRTLRIVDAPTRWPSLSSSPWILLYPQPLFSVAGCSLRAAISALTGDRPVRLGQIHLRVTRRRCQRRTVPGVTSRCARSLAGRSRISAARIERSAHSRRGREVARRREALSWRVVKLDCRQSEARSGEFIKAWEAARLPDDAGGFRVCGEVVS